MSDGFDSISINSTGKISYTELDTTSINSSSSVLASSGNSVSGAPLTSVLGLNVGHGNPLYAGFQATSSSITLNFRSISAGPGLLVETKDSNIVISSANAEGVLGLYNLKNAPSVPTGKNSILVGDDLQNLSFVSSPITANTTLVYDGANFNWLSYKTGTVTSINLTSSNSTLNVVGSSITTTGSFDLGLSLSGVIAGNYIAPTVTVDSYGRITNAQSNVLGEINTIQNLGTGTGIYSNKVGSVLQLKSIQSSGPILVTSDANSVYLAVNAVSSIGITTDSSIISSGGPITTSGNIAIKLSNTNVLAGTYTNASITVDAQGRISYAASNIAPEIITVHTLGTGNSLFYNKTSAILNFKSVSVSGPLSLADDGNTITISATPSVTSVGISSSAAITVTNSPITTSGTIGIDLVDSGVVAQTYIAPTLTINSKGIITGASSNTLGEINSGQNTGIGASVYNNKTGPVFQFRNINAGFGISVVQNTSDITISSTVPTGPTGPQGPIGNTGPTGPLPSNNALIIASLIFG